MVKSDHCVGRIQCVAICVSVLLNQLEALDPIHFGSVIWDQVDEIMCLRML